MNGRPVAAAVVVWGGGVLMVRRAVPEGELVWQFPAGKIEAGESAQQAAVRETLEETGLTVSAVKVLGERVHPKTGRHMSYVACTVERGTAAVAADEELAEVRWAQLAELPELVPYGLFAPVQGYLDAELAKVILRGTFGPS
ncbi:NUDIX hydrolase [Streptacidiphilus sp. MAP5-3]|uniref:NUDIX hydrolase n=1 Tax=unclassified Streptacidiphilus TaxID=2643834 RepID=UPI003515E2A4